MTRQRDATNHSSGDTQGDHTTMATVPAARFRVTCCGGHGRKDRRESQRGCCQITHLGGPPFIAVNIDPSERDALRTAAVETQT
jgi:hypothetical protein